MNNVSRRNFIKGAGIAALGTAAAGALAGCGSEAQTTDNGWMPSAWEYETDVLVIGYGGAGLWTALTAKDEGGADVLVLEKAPSRGGGNSSINFGEFTWIDNVDKATQYIEAFTKGLTPEDIARTWAEECYKNLDYCDYWGLTNATVLKGSGASGGTASCEYPFLPGSEAMHDCAMGENGNAGWYVLDQARAGLGIEVLFSCHDEELIQNPETKEIIGAYTLIGDSTERKAIKAKKAVVMTLGGFEMNEEMRNQYLKCYPARGFFGWPFNTGDGFEMVQKVGAQLQNMGGMIGGSAAWFSKAEQPYAYMLTPASGNFVIVDRLGKRWMAESDFLNPHNGWHHFQKFNDTELADYERIPAWYIMDQHAIDAGPLGQTAGGNLMTPSGAIQTGMGLPDIPEECGFFEGWSEDNQDEVSKGWILKADTLDELAELMNQESDAPDADSIKTTIAQYNEYCTQGVDPDFNRVPDTMQPVSTPPYYAFASYPGGCNTLGGPKKNASAQVLDVTDEVIPRLYAAGSFGNMSWHTYGITGGNNAENMVWGRIAGRHAASLESWVQQEQ